MQKISFTRLSRLIRRQGMFGLARSIFFHVAGAAIARAYPAGTHRALASFVSGASERPLLVVSGIQDWSFPFRQRLHHLSEALADIGWRIIYISPSSGYDHFFWQHKPRPDILVSTDQRSVLASLDAPLFYLASADNRYGMELYEQVRKQRGRIVYDYLDAIDDKVSNVTLSPSRLQLHEVLLRDESQCFCIAAAKRLLADVEKRRSRNYAFLTNGVDAKHFNATRQRAGLRSDFLEILDRGNPIIGYYGALASWFDYDLVLAVAGREPDWDIVLIGPDYDGTMRRLEQRPGNLHVLEPIVYADLPRHAVWFDVAIIPFVINDITDATSPLKLFEYMALGRPIVSTGIPEARRYRSVFVADGVESFIANLRTARERGGDCDYLSQLATEAAENDWTAKACILDQDLRAFALSNAGLQKPQRGPAR